LQRKKKENTRAERELGVVSGALHYCKVFEKLSRELSLGFPKKTAIAWKK